MRGIAQGNRVLCTRKSEFMDCSKVQSMIEPFLKNELSNADKDSFISHVRTCRNCHDELEVYHVIYSVIEQFDNNTEDENIDYIATLEKKLTRSEDGVKRRRLFRQIAITAGIVVIMVAICLLLM